MSTSKKKLTGTQMKSVKAGREITLKKYAANINRKDAKGPDTKMIPAFFMLLNPDQQSICRLHGN